MRLHHLVAAFGLGVLAIGLWLAWNAHLTRSDLQAAVRTVSEETSEGGGGLAPADRKRRQILVLKDASTRRLRNLSFFVCVVGFGFLVGAGILKRVSEELAAMSPEEESGTQPPPTGPDTSGRSPE